MIAFIIVVWFC